MMRHPQASVFLDHDAVHTRLHGSMMRWLNEIFHHPLQDEKALVAHQRLVGEVHPDYQHMIKQADDAMYEAKHQGRNRVTFANTAVDSDAWRQPEN